MLISHADQSFKDVCLVSLTKINCKLLTEANKLALLKFTQRDLEVATNMVPSYGLFSVNSDNVSKFYISYFLDCEPSSAFSISKL